MIYLDNAASTMVAPEVITAMKPFFASSYGNPGSIHRFGRDAKEAIEQARKIIGDKIGAKPEEIVFTSGGTESNGLAIKGVLYKTEATVGFKKNKNNKKGVVTTSVEHPSLLNVCRASEHDGFTVSFVGVNHEGFVNFRQLQEKITERTALVSVIHGNNEIGTVNDIRAIGKLCREKGVLFHTDACQSFLKEDIDVKKMGVDLLTLNGHKIHGPKGVGALYVREGVRLRPLFLGGQQEHEMRAGTENVPGIVGFGKAVELWKKDDVQKMTKLREKLIDGLLQIPNSQLNGSREKRLCNNVNASFKGIEGEALVRYLDQQMIMASTGSACTSHQIEASHVLRAIGLDDEWAGGTLRLSLSRFTTSAEIIKTVDTTQKIIAYLRAV